VPGAIEGDAHPCRKVQVQLRKLCIQLSSCVWVGGREEEEERKKKNSER